MSTVLSLTMVTSFQLLIPGSGEQKILEQSEFLPELNPLQILLLVFVEFGLATPYDLLSKAGLGPGLTSPALKRLNLAGLLTCTPGPRNRMRYAITDKGAQLVRESLKPGVTSYWQLGKMDIFESLPRGIILAWLHSGVDEAHHGADRARHNLLVLAERRQREAKELRGSMFRLQTDFIKGPATDKGTLIATTYQWIKAECDATFFRLQAEAIRDIHKLIADLGHAPRARRDKKRVR
jgi:DNA-binding MarR family transcriptional regulator